MRTFSLFATLTLTFAGCATRGSDADTASDMVGGGYTVGTPSAGSGGGSSSDNTADDTGSDDADADTDTDTDADSDADSDTDTDTDSDTDADSDADSGGNVDTDTGSAADDTEYDLYIGWTSNVTGDVDVYVVNLSCPNWGDWFVDPVDSGEYLVMFDFQDLGCAFEWGDTIVINGEWSGGARYLVEATSWPDDGQHIDEVGVFSGDEGDDFVEVGVYDITDDCYRVAHSSDPGADLYCELVEPE